MVAPKYDPTRRCRPVEEWPELDQQAWAAALVQGDLLEPGGLASGWGPVQRRHAVSAYGRWLTWLDRAGRLTSMSPAGQVTPEHVRDFVANLTTLNASITVVHRIGYLARMAGALAPDRDWVWLWNIAKRLKRRAAPARDKQSRLAGADELFALGKRLMAEAEGDTRQGSAAAPWRRAVAYRDGLMIAFLALRPLRMRNLLGIELGRQLTFQGGGHRLSFTAAEIKTRRVQEQPFPEVLIPALECYLSHHRPVLCALGRFGRRDVSAPPSQALWVGTTGLGLGRDNVYGRITRITREAFGRSINPHLFRDAAATSIATENPSRVGIVMSVLGHTRLSTSERHYNHATAVQAARTHQAHIMALRRKARQG